jgi:dienelactone hydrolase
MDNSTEVFRNLRRLALGVIVAFASLCGAAHAQQANKQNGEAVQWDSVICRISKCEPLKAKGWLFTKPGDKAVVIISHGSVGVDYRVFDRVDHLRKAGYAALVVDHWGSRGLGEIYTDLMGGPAKGASEFNMVLDIYTAASMLRKERDFDRVGAIGASYGGGANILANQKWAMTTVEKTIEYWYKKPFVARPLDAQVSLYGFCGYRNLTRDAFNGAPILLMNGDLDAMDPASLCEKFAPYANTRGGKFTQVTLKGAYHTFDMREPVRYDPKIKHTGKCDLVQDEKGVLDQATGHFTPGSGPEIIIAAFKECGTAYGATHGTKGDPMAPVPTWIGFFQQHMPASGQ